MLNLIAEVLREPAFPAAEFELLKQGSITETEGYRSEPNARIYEELTRHFNRYPRSDARYALTTDERLAAFKDLTLDDVKRFYKDFYGASNGEIAVVGDFDAAQAKAQFAKIFGDWKSPAQYARFTNQYLEIAPVNQTIETPDKENAAIAARLNIKLSSENPDYAALLVANHIFGGGFINSRFMTRVRGKEGLSYGGSTRLTVSPLDEAGSFDASAISAPQNTEKVEIALREELARVIKEGFSAAEVEDAKKGLLLDRRRTRADDFALVEKTAALLGANRSFAFEENMDQQLKNLTVEDVNRAFRRYVTPDKLSVFKAGDFAKNKK